jgi:hypothetical protein
VLVLLALGLAAPALRVGLGADDLVHRARLTNAPPLEPTRNVYLELFDFIPVSERLRAAMRETGMLPWWTHPDARGGFPRPLSAATHVLDYRLWRDNVTLQHAHSLVWFAAAILVAVAVFRRLCREPAVAAAAALMFAVADSHALPAAWLANRNALVAFVFGGLALVAHVRWRRGGGPAALGLALAALAAGLLGAEAALGALGYIVAFELFLDDAPRARRALALLPYALVVLGWQAAYRALDFGVAGMGLYQDPAADPLAFAAAVAERLPLLLLAQWTHFSSDVWVFLSRPAQLAGLAAALVVCVALALLFRRQLREEAEARFWAAGMLLALVPTCAVFSMDRLLIFAGLGAFALLAGQAARLGWIEAAAAPTARTPAGRGVRIAVGALCVLHLAIAPLLLPLRIVGWSHFLKMLDHAERALPDDPRLARESVVWVNGMDLTNIAMLMARVVRGAPLPRASHVLASFAVPARVTRRDAHTVVLEPEGGFLASSLDRLVRGAQPPFRVGERVATLDYVATVEAVTADGRPARVGFRFRVPLEDPSLRWMCLGDGIVPRTLRPPAIGESLTVPAAWLW